MARTRQEQLIADGIRHALNTEGGRALIVWLFEITKLYRLSFNAQSPPLTNFAEGGRNIGLQLLARVTDVNPDALGMLLKEAAAKAKENERRDSERAAGERGDAGNGSALDYSVNDDNSPG